MSSGSLQFNTTFIEPLPRFFTTRFGRRTRIENEDDDDDDNNGQTDPHCEPKINEVK